MQPVNPPTKCIYTVPIALLLWILGNFGSPSLHFNTIHQDVRPDLNIGCLWYAAVPHYISSRELALAK